MRRFILLGLLALAGCQESTTPSSPGGVAAPPGSPVTSPGPTDKVDDQGAAADASSTSAPPLPWPFKDPDKLAVITLTRILNGSKPILYVVHDQDGDWQFLDGDDVSEEDAETVAFKRVVELDRSLGELADLPNNWTAEREAVGQPWTRAPRN